MLSCLPMRWPQRLRSRCDDLTQRHEALPAVGGACVQAKAAHTAATAVTVGRPRGRAEESPMHIDVGSGIGCVGEGLRSDVERVIGTPTGASDAVIDSRRSNRNRTIMRSIERTVQITLSGSVIFWLEKSNVSTVEIWGLHSAATVLNQSPVVPQLVESLDGR